MITLTCHREILPSAHPLTGEQRAAGLQAARTELREAKLAYLSSPYDSPRLRRRYNEALQARATYDSQQ